MANRRLDLALRLIGDGVTNQRLNQRAIAKGIHPEDVQQGIDAGIRAGLIDIDLRGRWIKAVPASETTETLNEVRARAEEEAQP